jgi:hypothetical protein
MALNEDIEQPNADGLDDPHDDLLKSLCGVCELTVCLEISLTLAKCI